MIKLIINEDTLHPIEAENFNYSVTLKIDDYSERNDNVNFNLPISSISNVNVFENTIIESIKILTAEDKELTTLNFTNEDFYILNYNTNVYGEGSNGYVNMGHVIKRTNNEEVVPE